MSPKTQRRRARGDARHVRRVQTRLSRRSLLKGAGAAAASLFFPRMVHAVLPRPLPHPTWDMLLDHIGANGFGSECEPTIELREWVHGLVLQPCQPQRALLLSGPEAAGKAIFYDAMGLLVPRGGVVQFPGDTRIESGTLLTRGQRICLDDAWLAVLKDVPRLCAQLLGRPRCRNGRVVKWSLTYPRAVERPFPNTVHYNVRPPALVIPKADLIRLLEDERDAFQSTLRRCAA